MLTESTEKLLTQGCLPCRAVSPKPYRDTSSSPPGIGYYHTQPFSSLGIFPILHQSYLFWCFISTSKSREAQGLGNTKK
jgi:hypothetical protein